MTACARNFDEIKCMFFLIEDCEMLEKYNKIWENVGNSIKKVFDSKLIDNEHI